jgi:aldehyde dehydrogenase (NAD+)
MTSSAQLPPYTPERRMLIDGELVASADGGEFDNVNPATEEVLGQVADGTADDMRRAIGAARRAFDETDWSAACCSSRKRSRPRSRSSARSSSRR